MNKKSSDIFEANTSSTNNKFLSDSNNFFLSDDNLAFETLNKKNGERSRRLNDYDFNLLKEDAYKDVSDDLFKLEYKISRTEDEIKSLNSQIQIAKDINDEELLDELYERYKIAQEDYDSLIAMYNDKSLSARVSEGISSLLGERVRNNYNELREKLNEVSNKILRKLPKQFTSLIELKNSLNKLENINRSVDELMSMNIPYGENINKYEQLSKYIIKANSIQGELAKYLKK